jgi:DNA primase
LKYLESRGIGPDWYDFMYSPDKGWDVFKRLLIPFYWRGDVVGFTGRMFEQSDKVKYYTDVQPGYVFNMDAQDWSRKFVLVTEGPFDAITVSGVSILGSEINDTQRELIEGLGRQIIVVPDRDAPGQKLVDQATEFGWGVAFPEWDKTVGDVADAVLKYGRLFTIQSILKTTETSKLKIDLKRKMYG